MASDGPTGDATESRTVGEQAGTGTDSIVPSEPTGDATEHKAISEAAETSIDSIAPDGPTGDATEQKVLSEPAGTGIVSIAPSEPTGDVTETKESNEQAETRIDSIAPSEPTGDATEQKVPSEPARTSTDSIASSEPTGNATELKEPTESAGNNIDLIVPSEPAGDATEQKTPSEAAGNSIDSIAPGEPTANAIEQKATSELAGTGSDAKNPSEEPAPEADLRPQVVSNSRWVDYDTHELIEMISELEDERRWARLREGIWIAILFHILLISAITWIPKYVFRVPPVIDPFDAIKQRKDIKYLDLPPDLVQKFQQPKVEVKPVPQKRPEPQIDKDTLDAMNKPTPPPLPEPATPPKLETPPLPQVEPPPVQPSPKLESPIETPHPPAVPARPNFAIGSQNPADQLRDAMRNAAPGQGADSGAQPTGGLARHPGAGAGGVTVLSDTQGVDFNPWLQRWYYETEHTWDPLIPDEVNAPILKSGSVQIRFKVQPNGRVTDMVLEGRSGDTALDRAAWGAITGSSYPPLPRDFHGPYLELRALFLYNEQQPK